MPGPIGTEEAEICHQSPVQHNGLRIDKMWQNGNRNASMQRADFHRVDETLIDHLANVDAAFPRSMIQTAQSS
jgi:hypothetical protein